MVSREDALALLSEHFTKFFYDNFWSTEQQVQQTSQTGYVDSLAHELTLSTGVQSQSFARFYYNSNRFNPTLSALIFKAAFSAAADSFAFFGFKKSNTAPAFDMTESHAGFMLNEGKLYISVGDSETPTPHQQRIEIKGWDVTNYIVFKIEGSKFSMRPLPEVYPYFGEMEVEELKNKLERKWHHVGTCSTVTPEDSMHFICAHIGNTVNANRALTISHVIFGERYAD